MPCGQKKNNNAMSHSQTVTPPLAAIDGTTFRLKTATTNSKTRSQRPRTRFRCGGLVMSPLADKTCSLISGLKPPTIWRRSIAGLRARAPKIREPPPPTVCRASPRRADKGVRPNYLPGHYFRSALLLGLGERRRHIFKSRQVFVDIGFCMLHRDGPLLVPPIRLRHNTTVDHGEPIVPPQVGIDRNPVAVVTNLLRKQHQSAIGTGHSDIALQAGFCDRLPITINQFLAELFNVLVILMSEHFAERGQTGGHRYRVGVIGAPVEDLVLRDEIHD